MATTGSYGYRVEGRGNIKIQGITKAQRDIRNFDQNAQDDLKVVHLENAKIVAAVAGRLVPYKTGKLAESVRAGALKNSGVVRAGFPRKDPLYAGPIHFGWPKRRITPNPFIYDALDQRKQEVIQNYVDAIDRLTNKYGLR
jgi:hypothetical protein